MHGIGFAAVVHIGVGVVVEQYDGLCLAHLAQPVNDVFLDEIDCDMVKDLVRQSYLLILNKLPKRLREKYIFEK